MVFGNRVSRSAFAPKSRAWRPVSNFIESLEGRLLFAAAPVGYVFRQIAIFDGTDGTNPTGTLVTDSNGDIFGITKKGGASGDGAIYEIARGASNVTLLASFDGTNGMTPGGGLAIDSSGNIFGTTTVGGASSDGTLWELTAADRGTIVVLSSFNGTNGSDPSGDLFLDGSDNVFGTAGKGGTGGFGTLWEESGGTITPLVNFTNGLDGSEPSGGVVPDGKGNLFGTSFVGGASGEGCVWEFTIGGSSVTVLAAFNGTTQGANPEGGMAIDAAGDLFGTSLGDVNNVNDSNVWDLPVNSGAIESDGFFLGTGNLFFGGFPESTPILDSQGNLFGTTDFSGAENQGVIYEVPVGSGQAKTLATFVAPAAEAPDTSLIMDSSGDLFGAAELGGDSAQDGVFYELLAPGAVIPAKLAMGTQPTTTQTSGNLSGPISIKVESSKNKLAFNDDSQVTLGISSETNAAALSGTTTVNAVGGIATFTGLSLNATGTFVLTASDAALKIISTRKFVVPVALQLAPAQGPSDVVAGTKMGTPIVVAAEDQFSQIQPKNHSAMRLNIISGPAGGRLIGGTAVVSGGVATFKNLVVDKAGTYTLSVSDGRATPIAVGTFNVLPAAASKMVFVAQPPSTTATTIFSAEVELVDRFGNLANADASSVTLALGGRPSDVVLSGTLTQAVSGGVVDYTDLAVNEAGVFTLKATDGTLRAASSKLFRITA